MKVGQKFIGLNVSKDIIADKEEAHQDFMGISKILQKLFENFLRS
ncbi:hypothetical protein [Bacillus sp. FJAT-25509]|nr:hypothetical protein [Bacillus sp. FJAT-25509]